MKKNHLVSISIFAALAIGCGMGYVLALYHYRHVPEQLKAIQSRVADFTEHFNEQEAEYSKAAKPYEASGASIGLVALKCLDTNNIDGARAGLAALISVYYRSHLADGDKNLLTNIVAAASTDFVLSNAIYDKSQ